MTSPAFARGALLTASNASSVPSPYVGLTAAVPPQVLSAWSWAEASRMARVFAMSPISEGAADQSRATVPLTCGVAIDVPLLIPYREPGTLERIA